MRRIRWRVILPPLATFVVVTVAAEMAFHNAEGNYYFNAPPSAVVKAMWKYHGEFAQATLHTGEGAVLGLCLSVAVGLTAGLLLSSWRWAERTFYPYAVFFQTVPVIAIAPQLVIWLNDTGLRVVVASAFIVSLFPLIAGTIAGVHATDPALRDLFRLYRAGPFSTMFKLRLPSALPSIVTGLRVAGGLAVIGAIVGEFIVGSGLGLEIAASSRQGHADRTFAAILLATLLGLALFGIVNLVGHFLLRRRQGSNL